MNIDRNRIYKDGEYSFQNFVTLDKESVEMVRIMRNHPTIREVMYSKDEISAEQHEKFLQSLKTSDSKYYWLVKKEGTPIGVVSLINVDTENREGESGFYLFPDYLNMGLGIEFIGRITNFLFTDIGCLRLYGRILITNKNSLMINHLFGFEIGPQIIKINGEEFVEVSGNANRFLQCYASAADNGVVLKKLKEFNKHYKHLKRNGNQGLY